MDLQAVFTISILIRQSLYVCCQGSSSSLGDSADKQPDLTSSWPQTVERFVTQSTTEGGYTISGLQKSVGPIASTETLCVETGVPSKSQKRCLSSSATSETSTSKTGSPLQRETSILTTLPEVSEQERSTSQASSTLAGPSPTRSLDATQRTQPTTTTTIKDKGIEGAKNTTTAGSDSQDASLFAVVFGILGGVLVFGIIGMVVRNVYIKNKNKVKKIKRPKPGKGSKRFP